MLAGIAQVLLDHERLALEGSQYLRRLLKQGYWWWQTEFGSKSVGEEVAEWWANRANRE